MVLQDKWDRKATRARARKFKAKGKDLPEAASQKAPAHNPQPSNESDGTTTGDEDEEQDEGGEEDGEEEDHGQFSRRKIADNAWRYESTEDPNLCPEEEEEEVDYGALTVGREQDLGVKQEAVAVDDGFLRELEGGERGAKGKVVSVDRSEFVGIREKIEKRDGVEAFRKRFARGRKKEGEAVEGGDVDVDVFLEELAAGDVKGHGGNKTLEGEKGRDIKQSMPPRSAKKQHSAVDDDEWLDAMLGR